MSFSGYDSAAQGEVTYHTVEHELQVHYDLVWNGAEEAEAEVATGFLWSPPLAYGSATADAQPIPSWKGKTYSGDHVPQRTLVPGAKVLDFSTPVGAVSAQSTVPLTLLDGKGSGEEWAAGHDYLWLGAPDVAMPRGKHVTFDVTYRFDIVARNDDQKISAVVKPAATTEAMSPDSDRPPLIPKPMSANLDWDHPLVCDKPFSFPAGVFDHIDVYKAAIARRFLPSPPSGSGKIAFDGGVSKFGLTPGGYRISISDHSISVLGEQEEGLVNGLERLAALGFAKGGKLCFPTGLLKDQPKTTWRGVHLFVGKDAPAFQSKLWTRVLRPLGFNKVVLQCERTHWDSFPLIDGPITMPKASLVKLFEMYRGLGVEPIPLIQSYGHMEWFFNNRQNLDVAADPQEPYAVDPANPKTKSLFLSCGQRRLKRCTPRRSILDSTR